MNGMKLLLLALFLLLAAASSEAATYWVSFGSDGNQHCFNSATQPGNLATQTSWTITQGIQCLKSGDTLYILPGTYDDTIGSRMNTPGVCGVDACIPNGTPNANTTVSAAPGFERQVFINGDRKIYFQGYVEYITIRRLVVNAMGSAKAAEFGNCAAPSYSCYEQPDPSQPGYPGARHITIDNNEFYNTYSDCSLGNHFHTWIRNHIHHCGTHGIYVASNNLIEGNYI